MKQLPAILLCVLFAATAAEARTLYVNAKRPNNNGNGLKPATAKKTIQAAVNLAQAGDTILVQPGEYAPFKTNNKKITIKSVKGASKTKIVKTAAQKDMALAQLGKTYTIQSTKGSAPSAPLTKGKNTVLAGFFLDGKNRDNGYNDLLGVSGGTVKSCAIRRLGKKANWLYYAAGNATLVGCTVSDNQASVSDSCVFKRCKILDNGGEAAFQNSRLFNCLVAGNKFYGFVGTGALFGDSVLVNCTIAKNLAYRESGTEKVPLASRSKFVNCILRGNRLQTKTWEGKTGTATIHNVDAGNGYGSTFKDNRNPKFVDEAKRNCKLAKGSPCIDRGKLTAEQKKLVGSKDLGGGKRVKGKAVDMGCYEY
jgi:hypothetical protein